MTGENRSIRQVEPRQGMFRLLRACRSMVQPEVSGFPKEPWAPTVPSEIFSRVGRRTVPPMAFPPRGPPERRPRGGDPCPGTGPRPATIAANVNSFFTLVGKCAIHPRAGQYSWEGFMKAISLLQRNPLQGKFRFVHQAAVAALIFAVAATALAQTGTAGQPTTTGQQPGHPPAVSEARTPQLAVALIGPARELKFAEYTWFRFGAQVQLWFKAAQDRIKQPDGSEGSYAFDFYCRRCRFFTTGSVIKNVFFNV